MSCAVLLQAFRECEPELLRFLGKRVGSSATASDIAQDLYIKLLRTKDIPPIENGKGYLFRMAANLAIDHVRVEGRRQEILEEADGIVWQQSDELTPERHVMARAELDHMKSVIGELAPRCRQVFYLSRFEGKTQAEISAILNIGVTTVYKDLKLAIETLLEARRAYQESKTQGVR